MLWHTWAQLWKKLPEKLTRKPHCTCGKGGALHAIQLQKLILTSKSKASQLLNRRPPKSSSYAAAKRKITGTALESP